MYTNNIIFYALVLSCILNYSKIDESAIFVWYYILDIILTVTQLILKSIEIG